MNLKRDIKYLPLYKNYVMEKGLNVGIELVINDGEINGYFYEVAEQYAKLIKNAMKIKEHIIIS